LGDLKSTLVRNPGARFGRYLQRWWETQLNGASYPSEWLQGRDASAIAREFRRDAQFAVAQGAFLHRRPGEGEAREIVERLVPAPIEADETVLVEAVVRAGATAQRVRTTTVAGAILTVAALAIRNILRRR
jgi:hypothetical protein